MREGGVSAMGSGVGEGMGVGVAVGGGGDGVGVEVSSPAVGVTDESLGDAEVDSVAFGGSVGEGVAKGGGIVGDGSSGGLVATGNGAVTARTTAPASEKIGSGGALRRVWIPHTMPAKIRSMPNTSMACERVGMTLFMTGAILSWFPGLVKSTSLVYNGGQTPKGCPLVCPEA